MKLLIEFFETALISVFDKTGVVQFAKQLENLGFSIAASGGTATKLRSESIKVSYCILQSFYIIFYHSGDAYRIKSMKRQNKYILTTRKSKEILQNYRKLNCISMHLIN